MFPVSGVQSVYLPVANSETGTVYPQTWIYSYNNSLQSSYALRGNAAGFSGLCVNNSVQPYPYEHQVTAAYYPVVGVLTVAQGGLNTNTPYDQRVVPSSITSPSVSGQDEPSSQIKSEVNDEIADQHCRFASKTENVDSSMAENMKREKGFTDLQTNMRVEYPGFGVMRFPQGTLHENTPLEQHIDPSSVMSCTKSEQDVLSSQIKTEVNDDQAYQSSLEVKVEREEYSNLEGIEANMPVTSELERKETVCSFCDKTFSDINALQDHLPSHNDMNSLENKVITEKRQAQGQAKQGHQFSCKMCACKFKNATELRIHLFFHSGKTPKCEVCSRTFQLRKHLKGHMMVHEKERNFKCNICEKEFLREYILRKHIVTSHSETTLKCDTCNRFFTHPKRQAEHKNGSHSSTDDMKCDKCDERLSDLSTRKLTHSKGGQFICFICHIVFARKKDLTHHKSTSHLDKDKELHHCGECHRKFKLLKNLIDHKKLHGHDKTSQKFRCGNCSKVFVNDKHLILHTAQCQEQEQLLLCHKCGQFCDNRSFSGHLNSHSDTGGYTCEMCNEIFSNGKSFKIHVLRHKGITPPTCYKCGFECLDATALKRHIDCHNGVKAYECKECGKKYASARSLDEHMARHTGVRLYQCKLCHRSFPSRRNKVRHEQLHAKGFQRIRK